MTKPEVPDWVSAVRAAALLTDIEKPSRSRMVLSYSSLVSRRTGAAAGTLSLSGRAPAPGLPSGPVGGFGLPVLGSTEPPDGGVPLPSSLMLPVQPRPTSGAPRRQITLRFRNIS